MAAGLSSRMGKNKLIMNIEGKTIIERCILGMYEVCERIIVVGGYKIEDIRPILTPYKKV